MSELIKIKSCQSTGYACPATWFCETCDLRYLYIRYRDGWFSIEETCIDCVEDGLTIFCEKIGEDNDGYMDTNKMLEASKEILDFSDCIYLPLENQVFISFTAVNSPEIQEKSERAFVKSIIEYEKRDILIEIIGRVYNRLIELRGRDKDEVSTHVTHPFEDQLNR